MNFINRTLIVLQLLSAIALAPILIVALLVYRQTVSNTLIGMGNALISGQNAPLTLLVCIALAAIGGLIAVLFLFLELQRPAIRRLKIQQVLGGEAEITADAIKHRLEQGILQISDIIKVRPGIAATKKGSSVDVFLEVETSPDVNVPQKTQEVISAARTVTEEKIGLKVGKIQVRLDHSKKIKNKKDNGDGGRETQQQLPPPPQPQIPT